MGLNGKNGIPGSFITFGGQRRGWGFVPPGYGGVDFDGIIRALNQIGYSGPLSIGWEDSGMGRFFWRHRGLRIYPKINFCPSDAAFDDAIRNQ